VYDFKLEDAILPTTITSGPNAGIQLYDNIGNTNQQGLEWALQWKVDDIFRQLDVRLWNNGTLNHYRFGNYVVNESSLIDNALPGVPSAQVTSGIAIGSKHWNISITDYWFDKTPLNNANTVWSNPYHLLNIYADYTLHIRRSWELQFSTGINNALNTSYTSYYALNAFGSRFFNPAASRNFYSGIRLCYHFK
jgi:iron complex outermembrane receptor protein